MDIARIANRIAKGVIGGGYWYHGTPKEFDDFKIQTRHTFGDGPSETPLFFSPSEKFAKGYAGGRGTIYKVKLKWRKLFDGESLYKSSAKYWPPEREDMVKDGVKLYDDLDNGKIFSGLSEGDFEDVLVSILNLDYSTIEDKAFKKWMRRNGYDAFEVRGDGPTNIGVFSPSQVKVVDMYPARDV